MLRAGLDTDYAAGKPSLHACPSTPPQRIHHSTKTKKAPLTFLPTGPVTRQAGGDDGSAVSEGLSVEMVEFTDAVSDFLELGIVMRVRRFCALAVLIEVNLLVRH